MAAVTVATVDDHRVREPEIPVRPRGDPVRMIGPGSPRFMRETILRQHGPRGDDILPIFPRRTR